MLKSSIIQYIKDHPDEYNPVYGEFIHVEDEFRPMPFYHKWFVYWWARLLMAGMFKLVWESMCARFKYLCSKCKTKLKKREIMKSVR
jgi:hypothetical protein